MSWAYWKQVLISVDQVLNTLFGGYADETLSSRAWRHYVKGDHKWPCRLLDALLWFDPDHCRTSYESEIERRQQKPPGALAPDGAGRNGG